MVPQQPITTLRPPLCLAPSLSFVHSGSVRLQQEGEGRWKERREVEAEREGWEARGQLAQGTTERAGEGKRRAGVSITERVEAPKPTHTGDRRREGQERSCCLDVLDCDTQRHEKRQNHASMERHSSSSRLPGCLACVRKAGSDCHWEY